MATPRMKIAQLDEAQLAELRALEDDLGVCLVALEPGLILHYDNALDRETQLVLARKGVELVFFHPECVTAGGGSLRCMTLRLHRDGPQDRH